MRLNESDPVKRRVGPIRCIDSLGNPVNVGFAGNTYISINDGPFGAPGGSVTVIGDGYVYYEASAGECSTQGFICIQIKDICQEVVLREDIEVFPQGIPVNTVDPDDLHVGPFHIVDEVGDPLPDMTGITTQISINGSAWGSPLGTFIEIEDGYQDYIPDASEVTESGWIAIRLSGACQEYLFRSEISSVSGGGGNPVITAISPTPGVAPGDPGGFPKGRRTALDTPIVINVSDVDPGIGYLVITVRTFQDGDTNGHTELVVYRDGLFKEPFGDSTQTGDTTDLTLTLRRDGGWTGLFLELTIYAVDLAGNTSSETFIYELPATFEAIASTVPEGAVDHVAAALARIPWQFRSELH